MPIQNRFATAPLQLVNYDFVDVATNQAYIILYGHTDLALATTLIRQRISSHIEKVRWSYNGTGGGAALGEVNFDYQFAVPQKVKGKLYVFVPFFTQALGVQNVDTYLKIRILHFDGSTETLIGTQQTTQTLSESTDSSTKVTTATLTFDIDRQFKITEKLRVEVEVWSNSTTNSASGFYADPVNTDYGFDWDGAASGTPAPSNFIVYMPIKPVQ